MNDDNNKDDGSVWTSYSDLFTTVAIIFLVMFVFALIKAGVSSMQMMSEKKKHEKELKGELPKKIKEQNHKRLKKLAKSIEQMDQYENIISQKVVEMNKFAKNLKKNKKILSKLIDDQNRKEALLKVVKEKLEKTENKLKKEAKNKRELASVIEKKKVEIEKITKETNHKIQELELKKSELTSKNLQAKVELKNLQTNLKQDKEKHKNEIMKLYQDIQDVEMNKEAQIAELKKSHDKEIKEMKLDYKEDKKLQEKNIAKLKEIHEKEIQKVEIAQSKVVREFQDKIIAQQKKFDSLDNKKKNLEQTISQQSVEISDLKSQSAKLDEQIKESEIHTAKLLEQIQEKENKIKTIDGELSSLAKQKYNVEVELSRAEKSLKEKRLREIEYKKTFTQLESELKKTQQQAQNFKKLSQQFQNKSKDYLGQLNKSKISNNSLKAALSTSEAERENLKSKAVDLNQQMSDLQAQMASLEFSNGSLKKMLNNTKSDYQKKLANFESKLKGMSQRHAKELNEANGRTEDLLKVKDGLQQDMNKLLGDNQNLKSKVESLQSNLGQSQKLAAGEIGELKKKLAMSKQSAGQQVKGLEEQLAQSQKSLGQYKKDLNSLSTQMKKCEEEKKIATAKNDHKLKEKLAKALKENKELKSSVKNIGRKIASIKTELRSNIAKKLSDMFKASKISAKVDQVTGNVTLDLGKNFLFKKNSSRLSSGAKRQLKKIIPIYASVLFSDNNIKDQISSFNIEGHASPTHRQKYLDPKKIHSRAYSYNMVLSGQRASSISSYIFSKKIGSYSHKIELKEKTRAVGYGYSKPVKFNGSRKRSIASKNICYPYDCGLSQRVELSFTLKDDNDSLEKLFDMTSEVR